MPLLKIIKPNYKQSLKLRRASKKKIIFFLFSPSNYSIQ